MSHLEDEIGATALLATRIEDYLVYIDKREGHAMIAMPSNIGWRKTLNFGLLGRVLMAYMNEDEVNRILKRYPLKAYTPSAIKDEKSEYPMNSIVPSANMRKSTIKDVMGLYESAFKGW